jgi:hypothetical protein
VTASRRPRNLAARYQELARRLTSVGTSVPAFLDQVDALLATEVPGDAEEQAALDQIRDIRDQLRSNLTVRTFRTLAAGHRVWVPGHSPVSGGAGQFKRQMEVLTELPASPPAIAMHFRVPGYTRRGHYFDMESLGYVVLAAWRHDLAAPRLVKVADYYRPRSVWLTMTMTDSPGVEIAHEAPPQPAGEAVAVDLVIRKPPTLSARGTVIPELTRYAELSASPWLGLDLTFGQEVDIGEFGFSGPIKPLIDAMGPVLGRDRRGGPADHRLHDLRIRREDRDDGSVRARVWYCEE